MKRLFLVLMAELCSACPLCAAVITERNDVFSSFPDFATFRGSSSVPGIASQWIPYGTYTAGNGSTEYLRVTSNLVGVVASAFDGYWERVNVAYQAVTNGAPGAVGEVWTNDTLRILDHLNTRGLQIVHRGDGTYTTNLMSTALLEDDLNPAAGIYAEIFGSRALDTLCGSIAPPVPASWTSDFLTFLSRTNDWANVWPTYASVTNDGYIITNRTTYSRYHVWSFLDGLSTYAGSDYESAVTSLMTALGGIPAASSLTDVLAVDTGWATNDFKHWRDMSRRFDWKRLGLICQLERQMETSYDYWGGDDLPFRLDTGRLAKLYKGTLSGVQVRVGNGWTCDTVPARLGLEDFQWELDGQSVATSTNYYGTCYPTARFDGATSLDYQYGGDNGEGEDYFQWNVGPMLSDLNTELLNALHSRQMSFPQDGTFDFQVEGIMSSLPTRPGFSIAWHYFRILAIDVLRDFDYSTAVFIPTGTLLPIDTIYMEAELSKSASAAYTEANAAAMRTNIAEQLTFNDATFWSGGWIARRDLPTLDFMLSVTNSVGGLSDKTPLDWDEVSGAATNGAARFFRLNPDSPSASSRVNLNNGRIAAAMALDREVKSRFTTIAGVPVESVASVYAAFAPGEEAALWDILDALSTDCNLGIYPSSASGHMIVYGSVTIVNGEATAVSVTGGTDISPKDGEWQVGTWSIGMRGTGWGTPSTNATPARVDGHQSQTIKTLWRWKNLRDPNL